jgi:thioredoxin reductase (NADPH)
MYGARANMKTVVVERFQPGGQIANTEEVEDYPGFEHISGAELAMKMADHARKFGLEIVSDEVIEVRSEGEYRKVAVGAGGTNYVGKAIVVCTGGSPVLLDVPGEKEFTGKGVSYCAICDGAFFRGQIIAVVGGDAAVEGRCLPKFGSKVIVIQARPAPGPKSSAAAFANPRWNSSGIRGEQVIGDAKVRR